jgi:D-3-phosphoglycerate dehydrogenase / 2-oxoglutarate reductase
MSRVLIAPMTLANVQGEFLRVLQEAKFELVFPGLGRQLVEDEIITALDGIAGVVAGSEPYTPRVLDAHPQLKVIARVGVGYDAVDVPAATQRGVAVTIAVNTNQGSVAEHTFALMLCLAKRVIHQHNLTIQGGWPRGSTIPLRGQTLGIAGLGRIGKAMATRALAFDMKVIAYDPFPDRAFCDGHGVGLVSLDELFRASDYVTLHMPATPESRHLINARTLDLMKPTAFLLNTSRGVVVNEKDLYEALKARRIAGAGLDVFEEEPPGKIPLFELDNIVITPHQAGTDWRSLHDMARSAAEAIVSLSRGEWPSEKIVNPEVRAKFRW